MPRRLLQLLSLPPTALFLAPLTPSKAFSNSYWFDNLGFVIKGNCCFAASYLPLGVPQRTCDPRHQALFLVPLPGTWKLHLEEFHTPFHFTLLLSCLVYFLLVLFCLSFALKLKNTKKLKIPATSLFLFCLVSCFYIVEMGSAENTKLCDFTSTNNDDFICTPIAPPASTA